MKATQVMALDLKPSKCLPVPGISRRAFSILVLLAAIFSFFSPVRVRAQQNPPEVDEINDTFHFLGAEDALLIHEEEGKLKGQIDVFGGEEESDTILSYLITIGVREKNHVEFKTSKIHERYYRFSGAVERGTGREEGDPDYLRLVGEVSIVTVHGATGEETTERRQVVLKSLGADEIQE
jgi:hypothetical protein